MAKQQQRRVLPDGVGRFSKIMDAALPGKHTRDLYDKLKRREACISAQLQTGMAKLNGFLSRIGAVESDSAPVVKRRKRWNTSCSDVSDGQL